jgi:hypothetical protein
MTPAGAPLRSLCVPEYWKRTTAGINYSQMPVGVLLPLAMS